MPYAKSKNKDGTFKVINSDTGKIHAESTTEANANAQIRLLYMKEGESKPKKKLDWNTPRAEADKILKDKGYR